MTFADGRNSLFERNHDGSVKRVDGKPVARQLGDAPLADQPESVSSCDEGDRLMQFFKETP